MKHGPVLAWCLYDWACSAFNTIIVTFVFAAYFVRAVAESPARGTAEWATAQAIAGLVIAALAAPLGAVADGAGSRRGMLAGFTAILVVCTFALWFVQPRPSYAAAALVLVAAATVAYEIAIVFYNAMLADIAPAGRIGRLSGIAWGCGYAGGLVCLAVCLKLLIDPQPPLFGLSSVAAEPVRATALFAGGWIALFSCPLLVLAPVSARSVSWRIALRNGLLALMRALQIATKEIRLGRFLIARMLYTDGLTTLFAFGAIFAAGTFGMDAHGTLLLGIALNVTAGVGAFIFALIEDRVGAKPVVLISVAALTILGSSILLAHSMTLFWCLALSLGIFVGPAQASSRSLMVRLAPAESRNACFGLYALSGRVTGFVGPMSLGFVTALSGSQRAGMFVIVVLLGAGGLLLAATPIGSTSE
jgi:UMF1 family MFS transporter